MHRKDKADAVLVTFLISLIFIISTSALVLDISKNVIIKNELTTTTQNAAQKSVQKISAKGSLNEEAYITFLAQASKGIDISSLAESSCSSFVDKSTGKVYPSPYFKLALSESRGSRLGETAFDPSNPTLIEGDYHTLVSKINNPELSERIRNSGKTYKVLNVMVYESYPNFMLSMVGIPCQNMKIHASAVAFGSQEDL